ncbi:MAG TPA: hypothetical protein VFX16_37795 [Pseudonocardiaceae bacterium]|nr:hypothetical protein [Pseudonocardiaceae bacterium]
MTAYGFKVMELYATPPRRDERISFTEPVPDGLLSCVTDTANAVMMQGERDDTRNVYSRISDVQRSNWGLLIKMKGGTFGEPREVFDVDMDDPESPTRPINRNDAVLSDFRTIAIIPPHGAAGILIVETRSRSHLTTQLMRALNYGLQSEGLKLRILRETTDDFAWRNYLDQSDVDIKSIELVQTTQSPDRTRFTEENVKRARLQLDVFDNSPVKRRVAQVLSGMVGTSVRRPQLAGIVGLANFSDDDFDQQKIIFVKDGKERKIEVTTGWPAFTYTIDTDEPLTDSEFAQETRQVAGETLRELNVDFERNYWPRITD